MAKIVIIGAGLTGLSTAYHLEKKGFTDYKIFEKESTVGGLCRSVVQDGFTFDFTGHLLHLNDAYCKELISDIVGLDQFNVINRQSFIYSHNTYTRYPFQVNLLGLPPEIIAECIEGFVTRKKKTKKQETFYDWVLRNFGAGFGKHFFFTYQKKIFAYNIRNITASWTGRFVPQTSLKQIINGALTDTFDPTIGYNAQFLYPKQGGTISWVARIADHVQAPIHTQFCVDTIDVKKRVVHFTNGHAEPYDHLVTTMPLTELLARLKEPSTLFLQQAAQKLLCNSVVNFNLGVSRPDLSAKHWIYFPETQFPFYRIGFTHNFSTTMVPEGCSGLYGEFAHLNKSKKMTAQTLDRARVATQKLLNIQEHEIATEKVIHIPYAYVLYDFWREKNLPNVLKRLEEHSIFSIGRYGAWKYSSMQEALLEGKDIADQLAFVPAKYYTAVEKISTTV